MAISSLNANELINISSDYGHLFNLKKDEVEEIKKILIEKGRKDFYIFKYIAKCKNFLILDNGIKFIMEVPAVAERLFLEELNKKCYIKIIKRRTKKNTLYENEIMTMVKVFY